MVLLELTQCAAEESQAREAERVIQELLGGYCPPGEVRKAVNLGSSTGKGMVEAHSKIV